MSALTTEIVAFTVHDDDSTVSIMGDNDLSLQFLRGGVAPTNVENADALLAMCLGVDGEPLDLLVCGVDGVYEVLMRAKRAIDMALAGYDGYEEGSR